MTHVVLSFGTYKMRSSDFSFVEYFWCRNVFKNISKEPTLTTGSRFIKVLKNLFENRNCILFKAFCVVLFHRLKVLNRKVVIGQAFIQNSYNFEVKVIKKLVNTPFVELVQFLNTLNTYFQVEFDFHIIF